MVSTGMKVMKYILFVFNIIFFLLGILLVVAGILAQTWFREYIVFFSGEFTAAAVFVIIIGVIIFTIGFFGCCGAYKENHWMIMTFTVLLGLVFILEIAAAITARVLNNQLQDLVRRNMNSTIDNYNKDPEFTNVWDKVQKKLKCCGSVNYDDWWQNDFLANTSSVPSSCCHEEVLLADPKCAEGALNHVNKITLWEDGCAEKVIGFATSKIIIIGVAALVVAIIQIIGIIIACCLAAAIRKDYMPM